MSVDSTAVDNVSLEDILFNDVQMFLKNEAVLFDKVANYTARVEKNAKSVDVPKLSGISVTDRLDSGAEHTSGGMGFDVDTIEFDQHKIAPEYIYDLAREKTALDLDNAFLEVAPAAMADVMEQAIYAELKTASASAPDHIQQLTGAGNVVPTIEDIAKAGRILNQAKVPNGNRYLIVDPVGYEALMNYSDIRDASKSGSSDAIVKGQFAEIMGFKLLWSNNADAGEMLCWHPTALGFAMKKEVTFEKERQASKERDFVCLKASYGRKILDSGKRVVLFNATGA
jgi:hypothetical protein